jgi:hypothetical protein
MTALPQLKAVLPQQVNLLRHQLLKLRAKDVIIYQSGRVLNRNFRKLAKRLPLMPLSPILRRTVISLMNGFVRTAEK